MEPKVFSQWPGTLGTFQTVGMMKDLVNQSFLHPWIRERAAQVTQSCGRDLLCQDTALLSWVNSIMDYVKDPAGVEAIHDPVSFVEKRIRQGKNVFGDCDDMSIYLASLLKSIGHHPRFRIIGKKNHFHHVLVSCHKKNLDASMKIGIEPLRPGVAAQVPI